MIDTESSLAGGNNVQALQFAKNKSHSIYTYVYHSTAHSPYKYFPERLFGSVFQGSICMGYVRPCKRKFSL